MSEDKRRRSRVKAGFEASLVVDGKAVPVRTRDVSLKGALLSCDKEFTEGTPCELRLGLGPGLRLSMDARVARATDHGLAIEFQAMDDQSFTHLLQIVRLNADDADAIEDELADPAFDKNAVL
ncbi:PilZ domain-containing protein [Paucidesulfovibrio gracilis DSM 16080]|uniref:PilZ domain-containing protein n=1 Tax=Paucidesulfovibrio gracilis DSM 16080 TaxID=1121449 RepID=A0A1T4Y6G1_9BACT|nr:PilZ domain-containing protein [Paucidesulfovibrio gracilis]SKA97108.1 PilZ domain-containing protein [Paucidesulfovibrio gracilis DSM 16080]